MARSLDLTFRQAAHIMIAKSFPHGQDNGYVDFASFFFSQ